MLVEPASLAEMRAVIRKSSVMRCFEPRPSAAWREGTRNGLASSVVPLRVVKVNSSVALLARCGRRYCAGVEREDRQRFLITLGEACAKTGWQVHALCLLPNHFHLVVETPPGSRL